MLRLKRERLALGWSQVALAFHAGMSIGDISRIENGRLRPYPRQIEKLANVLRIDRHALLENVSEQGVMVDAGGTRDRADLRNRDTERHSDGAPMNTNGPLARPGRT